MEKKKRFGKPGIALKGRGTEVDVLSGMRARAVGRGRGGVILVYMRIGCPLYTS